MGARRVGVDEQGRHGNDGRGSGSARPGGRLGRHQPGPAQGPGPTAPQPVDQTRSAGQLLQGNGHAGPVPSDRVLGQLGRRPLRRPAQPGVEDRPAGSAHRAHLGPSAAARAARTQAGGRGAPSRGDADLFGGIGGAGDRRFALRGARSVADLHRIRHRRLERARLQRRAPNGRRGRAAVFAALSQGLDRSGQDPPASRDRPRVCRQPPGCADLLLLGRALHDRVRPGDALERDA